MLSLPVPLLKDNPWVSPAMFQRCHPDHGFLECTSMTTATVVSVCSRVERQVLHLVSQQKAKAMQHTQPVLGRNALVPPKARRGGWAPGPQSQDHSVFRFSL